MIFPNSKIVDENNNLLEVYHGTADIINRFEEDYGGRNTGNNEYGAFYFSNRQQVAEDYSLEAFKIRYEYEDSAYIAKELGVPQEEIDNNKWFLQEKAQAQIKVVKAYLDIENPLIIDMEYGLCKPQETDRIVAFLKRGILDDSFYEDYEDTLFNGEYDQEWLDEYKDEIEEYMKQNGIDSYKIACEEVLMGCYGIEPCYPQYDGLIIKNVQDNIGDNSQIFQDVYIALYPYQIHIIEQKIGAEFIC